MEEGSSVGEQHDLEEYHLPLRPLDVDHHNAEVTHEEDDLHGEGNHGD